MALFNKNPNEVAYTGDMELNIELHNICEEDLTKLSQKSPASTFLRRRWDEWLF